MRRPLGVGLVAAWAIALAFCGLARYLSSPLPAEHVSRWMSARLGMEVRVGRATLSSAGLRLAGIDVRSEAWDATVEEVKPLRTETGWEPLIVRPAVRLKRFERTPPASAFRSPARITDLRLLLGERELGPFSGRVGPEGLDLYCSTPVPIGLKGPLDDLYLTLGPSGVKEFLGGSGRFFLSVHSSPEGLSGEGELVIADVELSSWAGLKGFSGVLTVDEGPSLVLEQYGEAKLELAGTAVRLHDVRARWAWWAGGAVEGEAAIDSERGSARVRFTARLLGESVTLERASVEGNLSLPVGEGLAAVFKGAAEGWAEFLPAETRAEVRMPRPVSLRFVPEDGPPSRSVSLGGRVGLKLVGTGERTELSGRVEGLTLGGAARIRGEELVLSSDFSLSKEALTVKDLAVRGESGWVGRGEARLAFEGAGKLEGTFEFRGFALRKLCKKEETARLLSPGAKVYRGVTVSGPLGALPLKVKSGAYDLDFGDEKLGLALRGIELDVVDEAVIDLGK